MLLIIDNSIGENFVNSLLIKINNNLPYCLARGNAILLLGSQKLIFYKDELFLFLK